MFVPQFFLTHFFVACFFIVYFFVCKLFRPFIFFVSAFLILRMVNFSSWNLILVVYCHKYKELKKKVFMSMCIVIEECYQDVRHLNVSMLQLLAVVVSW